MEKVWKIGCSLKKILMEIQTASTVYWCVVLVAVRKDEFFFSSFYFSRLPAWLMLSGNQTIASGHKWIHNYTPHVMRGYVTLLNFLPWGTEKGKFVAFSPGKTLTKHLWIINTPFFWFPMLHDLWLLRRLLFWQVWLCARPAHFSTVCLAVAAGNHVRSCEIIHGICCARRGWERWGGLLSEWRI